MDGHADLGGSGGWGALSPPDPAEPVFTQRWHGRAFALALLANRLTGGNLDSFRHALERLDRAEYFDEGYFGRWLNGAASMLAEKGVLPPAAVQARARRIRGEVVTEVPAGDPPAVTAVAGAQTSVRDVNEVPRFAVGDLVRTRATASPRHTRLPRYARARTGTVERVHPAFVFPDTNATHDGENPQYVYSVRFRSRDLWGDGAEDFALTLEMFEDYLEAV